MACDLVFAMKFNDSIELTENRLEPTAMPSEYKYSKRRMFSSDPGEWDERANELNEIKQLVKNKLDYNHNGLIMSGVDNSTAVLLAQIQAKEQKRSAERSMSRRELYLNSRYNAEHFPLRHLNLRGKPSRSVIEEYLRQRRLKHRASINVRQRSSRSVIIEQPSQSLARVTFNFNGNPSMKSLPLKHHEANGRPLARHARLLRDHPEPSDGVVIDHLLLGKSFVLQKN